MWRKIKYHRWIMASLIIAVVDVASNSFMVEESPPEGMSSLRQLIGFMSLVAFFLIIPVSLPKVYLFALIESIFDIKFITFGSHFSEPIVLLFSFLGDLAVCFIYFIFFRAIYSIWRHARGKKANRHDNITSSPT